MSKQIKFTLDGINYRLPASAMGTSYADGSPVVRLYPPEAGKMTKQFIKARFPELGCQVSSSSFANGNSLDVYVFQQDGSEPSAEVLEKIRSFVDQFEYGRFNGMYDIYEHYGDTNWMSDNGMQLKPSVKYAMVYGKPRFDTVPWVLNEVRLGRDFQNTIQYVSPNVAAKAREKMEA